MKTGAGKFCASVVLPMPGCPCRTMIGGSFAVVRMICISILQGGACPIAADFELGLERYAEAVGFTGFAGMADEDFPYLLSDLWPANSYDLVVDPKRDSKRRLYLQTHNGSARTARRRPRRARFYKLWLRSR